MSDKEKKEMKKDFSMSNKQPENKTETEKPVQVEKTNADKIKEAMAAHQHTLDELAKR
jgi:hypothetical protein